MDLLLTKKPEVGSHSINDFIARLKNSNLQFDSEDLRPLGIENNDQLEKAVDRARFACSLAGLDLSWHFREYYIGTVEEVIRAWKMSQLAFVLAFLKADPLRKETATLQTEIAESLQENMLIRT